jgi:putative methyltransferase (TIGR04325 family)
VNLKTHLKDWIPPILLYGLQKGKRCFQNGNNTASSEQPEWEFIPEGWPTLRASIGGWEQPGVAEAYAGKWQRFCESIAGTKPLGVNHEFTNPGNECFATHNQVMSLAYVIGKSSLGRNHLKILDFGGALGHHYSFLRVLFPQLAIDYSCSELSFVCESGRRLNPEVKFFSDDSWQADRFDLVIASNSLQYIPAWQPQLFRLASVATSCVFVTKLPVVQKAGSFAILQRAWRYGYRTEYLGWCFNEQEFLATAKTLGLLLTREFLVFVQDPIVPNAPENPHYKGFLFEKQKT